jgi:hypothetical protein
MHARVLTFKTAKIRSVEFAEAIDCAVLNISEAGACILVPEALDLPQSFELTIDFGGVHACEVRWRSGSRLGVTFREILD